MKAVTSASQELLAQLVNQLESLLHEVERAYSYGEQADIARRFFQAITETVPDLQLHIGHMDFDDYPYLGDDDEIVASDFIWDEYFVCENGVSYFVESSYDGFDRVTTAHVIPVENEIRDAVLFEAVPVLLKKILSHLKFAIFKAKEGGAV